MLRMVVHVMLLFFPWWLRMRCLRWFFGYEIDGTARIGFSLIMPYHLEMEKFARIDSFTICKPIDRLHIGEYSALGKMNFITGISTRNKRHFQHVVDRKCELVIGQRVGIPPRKFIDCCGGVYIGDYTIIAGLWTQILTHGIDIYHSRQDAKPVKIGKYCFVGTGCTILAGAALPEYSVLGGGAVLNKAYYEGGWLYAGNPAQPKKKLNPIEVPWMSRTTLGVD